MDTQALSDTSRTAPTNEKASGHTPGPWHCTVFAQPDGRRIATLDDVVSTLASTARYSDKAELHGVCRDGSENVVCFTGNGPNSHNNAAFIVRACNAHDDLLASLKAMEEMLHLWMRDNTGPHELDVLERCERAIAKAEG